MDSKFAKLPDFPAKLRTLVEHMIVSHHGELEFGSPKVPIFAEALVLHHLDNLDSKMDAVRGALQRDRLVDGEFTGWIAPLERVLLKKDKYMDETKAMVLEPVAAAKPVPQTVPQVIAQTAPKPAPAPQNSLFAEKLQAVLEPHK
jgi:3'-5' exoribonuclease